MNADASAHTGTSDLRREDGSGSADVSGALPPLVMQIIVRRDLLNVSHQPHVVVHLARDGLRLHALKIPTFFFFYLMLPMEK